MKRHIINEKKSVEKQPDNQPSETVEHNKISEDDKTAEDSWAEDQEKKSYYYDDSYGYEVYNPDDDDDEDE